jgi:hypothetical protein
MKRCKPKFEILESRHLLASISFVPSQDNTLFQHPDGTLSSGAGSFLYIGKTNQSDDALSLRRALLQFDISSLPEDAIVNDVSLTVHVSKIASAETQPAALHRVLSSWGEGSSNAGNPGGSGTSAATGDATWLYREFPTSVWDSAGGDFRPSASGSTDITGLGTFTWSTSGMVSDVNFWRNNPSSNFGWIILGNESDQPTGKRLDSRENSTASNRPVLTIEYDLPVIPPMVSIAAAAVEEGDVGETNLVFDVTISEAVTEDATVDFSTVANTATADEDFRATSGTLRFTPDGPLTNTISVPVIGDKSVEENEQFSVILSNPSGLVIQSSTAIGTIINDDEPDDTLLWHNATIPQDVSGDGVIVPRDALLIINVLNGSGIDVGADVPLPKPSDAIGPPPYLDVSGDGWVSPIDALMVINWLNDQVAQVAYARPADVVAHRPEKSLRPSLTDIAMRLIELESHPYLP